MNECGGAEPGETPLQRCTEQSASHARAGGGGGGWRDGSASSGRSQSECGERQDEEQDERERASAAARNSSSPPPPPAAPPLRPLTSPPSPAATPPPARPPAIGNRARAPNPPDCAAGVLPAGKAPRWLGVNRHFEQRTKGKKKSKPQSRGGWKPRPGLLTPHPTITPPPPPPPPASWKMRPRLERG